MSTQDFNSKSSLHFGATQQTAFAGGKEAVNKKMGCKALNAPDTAATFRL